MVRSRLQNQNAWFWFSALPFNTCVTWSKLFNSSKPPSIKWGDTELSKINVSTWKLLRSIIHQVRWYIRLSRFPQPHNFPSYRQSVVLASSVFFQGWGVCVCVRCIYTSKFTYIPHIIESKMSSVTRCIVVLCSSKLNYDTLFIRFHSNEKKCAS